MRSNGLLHRTMKPTLGPRKERGSARTGSIKENFNGVPSRRNRLTDRVCSAQPSRPTHRTRPPGLLRKFMQALFESRRQQAERDIARIIERSGGKFTDDLERRIGDRMFERSSL